MRSLLNPKYIIGGEVSKPLEKEFKLQPLDISAVCEARRLWASEYDNQFIFFYSINSIKIGLAEMLMLVVLVVSVLGWTLLSSIIWVISTFSASRCLLRSIV